MHDGQYIVRATAADKGETLATGLAASDDVQVAEDRARARALAALGITADNMSTGDRPEAANIPTPESAPITAADEAKILPPPEPQPEPSLESSLDSSEEDLGPPIDAIAEDPVTTVPAKPSAAAIALESFNTSAQPVDLSDVIAQTDVELTRLGWTSAQGRDHLEKTYGKRSRQQLTDEELMSFLLYLEEQ